MSWIDRIKESLRRLFARKTSELKTTKTASIKKNKKRS